MDEPAQILVVLNGEPHPVPAGTTLIALIESLGLPVQGVLIEHNGRALLRDEHSAVRLAEGDRLEILRVVAGG